MAGHVHRHASSMRHHDMTSVHIEVTHDDVSNHPHFKKLYKTSTQKFNQASFRKMGLADSTDKELQVPLHPDIQGTAKLLTSGNKWHTRIIYLTKMKLCWTQEGNTDCLVDKIRLLDIVLCERIPYRPGDTIVPGLGTRSLSADYVVNTSAAEVPLSASILHGSIQEDVTDFYGFQVITKESGGNGGRTYLFEMSDETELQGWITKIEEFRLEATDAFERKMLPRVERWKLKVSRMFLAAPTSIFFAILILANFIVNALEAQYTPADDSWEATVFDYCDVGFTAVFTVELGVNMFAHLWTPFWSDRWNVFDFFVVTVSIAAIFLESIPVFTLLRLLRVFRVLRLFRKLRSLRIITNAIIASLLPVLDAVVILLVVTAVYAILGVELYGKTAPEFRNFVHSMFSMYQVATGDSWASSIARGMFEDNSQTFGIMAFFSTYTIISGMIMMNVVIAVLLDNFSRSIVEEEEFDHTPWDTAHLASPIDPLLKHLCEVESEEGIATLITQIFYNIDVDGSNSAGYQEFRTGLSKLLIWPKIHLSADEYKHMVQTNPGTDEFGQFDHNGFQALMRSEMTRYTKRMLIKNIVKGTNTPETTQMMVSLRRITDLLEGMSIQLNSQITKPRLSTVKSDDTKGSLSQNGNGSVAAASSLQSESAVSLDLAPPDLQDQAEPTRVPAFKHTQSSVRFKDVGDEVKDEQNPQTPTAGQASRLASSAAHPNPTQPYTLSESMPHPNPPMPQAQVVVGDFKPVVPESRPVVKVDVMTPPRRGVQSSAELAAPHGFRV